MKQKKTMLELIVLKNKEYNILQHRPAVSQEAGHALMLSDRSRELFMEHFKTFGIIPFRCFTANQNTDCFFSI